MRKVGSSRQLISRLTRKTRMPTSSRMPAKSFRERDRKESHTESYYSDEEVDDNIVDQQYDMFRDMYNNGHDVRVISHTMVSAGLDPSVVIPKEMLKQRNRSRSTASRKNGGTVARIRKGKKASKQPKRTERFRSNSQFEPPSSLLQSGFGFSDRNNADLYARNSSYVSIEGRNTSFNEMALANSGDIRPTSRYHQQTPVEHVPKPAGSVSAEMRTSRYQPPPQNPMHQFSGSPSPSRETRSRFQTNGSITGYQDVPSMTSKKWKRNQSLPIHQQSNHQQQEPNFAPDNATVYSHDAMSALTASRKNRGFIRKEKSSRTQGIIENLPHLNSGRNLQQYAPDARSYVPPPQSEIGSVTSRTKRAFLRRNKGHSQRKIKRQSNNSQPTMQQVSYNRQPRLMRAAEKVQTTGVRNEQKQRSSAKLPSTQSYSSTNHSNSLPQDKHRSDRPTRVAPNIPMAPERKKGNVALKLYPYDSDVYKPFKVMQILGRYPTEVIQALENAGLDPCVLYKGVDVNRHPNEPIKLQDASSDKWDLKYSKRYFTHYYQNKSTGETLWKDEVDGIAEKLNGQPNATESLMPHHITDDDI